MRNELPLELLFEVFSSSHPARLMLQGTTADNISFEKKQEGGKKGGQRSGEVRHEASERRQREHPESYGSS